MKNYGVFLFALFIAIMFVQAASAEIIFSQPKQFYSMGDVLEVSATIKEISPGSDFFTIDLVCGNESVGLYKNTLSFKSDETKQVNLNTLLATKFIEDLQGNCYLLGKFAEEETKSVDFSVSRAVDIVATFKSTAYNPGDSLLVSGMATKTNGKNVTGFVEVTLDTNLSVKNIVTNGAFNLNLTLPSDYAAGAHDISVRAYELNDQGDVTNEGTIVKQITVSQVLTDVQVSVDKENVKPGDKLSYTIQAYDQTGQLMDRDVSFTLNDADKKSKAKTIVNTNTPTELNIDSTFAPGYWEVEAVVDNFDVKKLFYVEAFESVAFDIQNDTLIVTNVGNVEYKKDISVDIGNKTFVKSVDLKVGASKKFSLQGNGEFDIKVVDGSNVFERSSVPLTGNAIRLDEVGGALIGGKILWLSLLVLAALALITNVYIRYRKNGATMGRKMSSIMPASTGSRESANVLALKVSNGVNAEPAVNSALEVLHKTGAKVYSDGAYKIAVFSKSLTGQDSNEFLALKALEEVMDKFSEHNLKMKDKIEYGAGLHKGELISENKEGKFSFTSIGSLIPATKRIAQNSNKDVLMSNEFYKTVMGSVKAEKDSKRDAWVLNRVVDRSKHDGFIKGFLGRYNKDQ